MTNPTIDLTAIPATIRGARPSVPRSRTLRPRQGVLLLLLALLLGSLRGAFSPQTVVAQTRTIDRAPDASMFFDGEVGHYAPRAIGDMTGDGVPDLLIQAVQRPFGPMAKRWLELHASPTRRAISGTISYPMTTFNVSRGSESMPLVLGDANGDGIQDIVFGEASRRGIDNFEHRRIAFLLGKTSWGPYYYVGEATRGDRKFEWRVPIPAAAPRRFPSRMTIRMADLNGDGFEDLIVAADPPQPLNGGPLDAPLPEDGESEIAVMFGNGEWLTWEESDPDLGREGGWVDRGPLRVDVLITGLGHCASSLGDIADVTGDGLPEILIRRCPGGGLLDLPGIVQGRTEWPDQVRVEGAVDEVGVFPAPSRETNLPPRGPAAPAQREAVSPRSAGLPGSQSTRRPQLPAFPGLFDLGSRVSVPALFPSSAGLDYLKVPHVGDPDAALMVSAPPLLARDIDGDGIRDVILGTGTDLHVWLGGSSLPLRLVSGRSDRVFLDASLAGAELTRAWAPADLDGTGDAELLLAKRRPDPASPLPVDSPPPPAEALHVFGEGWRSRTVINMANDEPDAIWQDDDLQLWGMDDLDGDGFVDLLVGTAALADTAHLGILRGPLIR